MKNTKLRLVQQKKTKHDLKSCEGCFFVGKSPSDCPVHFNGMEYMGKCMFNKKGNEHKINMVFRKSSK